MQSHWVISYLAFLVVAILGLRDLARHWVNAVKFGEEIGAHLAAGNYQGAFKLGLRESRTSAGQLAGRLFELLLKRGREYREGRAADPSVAVEEIEKATLPLEVSLRFRHLVAMLVAVFGAIGAICVGYLGWRSGAWRGALLILVGVLALLSAVRFRSKLDRSLEDIRSAIVPHLLRPQSVAPRPSPQRPPEPEKP